MAKDLKAKIKITADTKDADKKIDGLSGSIGKGLVAAAAAGAVAMAGLVKVVSTALSVFKVQESAVAFLDASLVKFGKNADKVSESLQRQASQLQRLSTFGDEEIIRAQALIAAFAKEEGQITSLTQATLDFAQAKQISLVAAAELLGKTLGSTTNALSRYGIEVDGAASSTERALSITQSIAELYGGQALAATNTLAGAQKSLSNNFFDTLEHIGENIKKNGELVRVMNLLSDAIFILNNATDEQKQKTRATAEGVAEMAGTAGALTGIWLKLNRQFQITEGVLSTLEDKVKDAKDEITDLADAAGDAERNIKALASAEKLAAAAAEALATEEANVTAQLEALGVILESSTKRQITDLNLLLLKAEDRFRAGTLSVEAWGAAQIAIGRQIDVLNASFENQNGLLEVATESTDTYTESVERATVQVQRLTLAEVRNADTVEISASRRIAARLSERQGILTNQTPGTQTIFGKLTSAGGQFSNSAGIIQQPNGKIVFL